MDLMNGNQVLRSFRVSLGLMPKGHKEQVGGFPHARRALLPHAPQCRAATFFLSIQVSYPNERDIKHAKANGCGSRRINHDPRPAQPRCKREPAYYTRDWTDGCIAVSNADMIEIWLLTNNNTPIDILP